MQLAAGVSIVTKTSAFFASKIAISRSVRKIHHSGLPQASRSGIA
jgi:hypothetical protein